MKKVLVPGLTIGVAMLISGMATSQIFTAVFPTVMREYNNTALFRPWSDPAMSLYFLHPFAVGILLSFLWQKHKNVFAGKGPQWALVYFVLTLPGMLISYASFPVSLLMIIEWTLSGFVQVMVAGLILGKMGK